MILWLLMLPTFLLIFWWWWRGWWWWWLRSSFLFLGFIWLIFSSTTIRRRWRFLMLAWSCDRDFLLIRWFPWIVISNLICGLSIILRCTERWWFITIREVTYNQVNSKPVWTMKPPDYWRGSLGPPIRFIKASISPNKSLTPGSFTSRLELLYTMLLLSWIVYRLSSLTFLLLSNCFRS